MSRIKKKKKAKFSQRNRGKIVRQTHDSRPVPRGWAYFTDCYLGAGAHPNMLKEWKRWRAGNMPILLDAFYCRDKRLSCLPLTSPLSPPPLPPPCPTLPTRRGKIAGRNECHERNLYFSTFHLLNGRETLPLLPPPREHVFLDDREFDTDRFSSRWDKLLAVRGSDRGKEGVI